MAKDAKIYIILPAGDNGPASNGLFIPALLSYRLGQDGALYRAVSKFPLRRGLISIDCSAHQGSAPNAAVDQIIHEYMAGNHFGVMLDTPSAQQSRLIAPLIKQLVPTLTRHGMSMYISHFSPAAGAVPIKAAAPLDGSVGALIKQISGECQGRGFALSLTVRGSVLALPGRDEGRRISPREAYALAQQHRAKLHYSHELEAMYALFRMQGHEHMLIWDTAETMALRVYSAINAGASAVFLVWPEMQHMWPQLQPLLWSVQQGSYTPKTKQNANHR